MVIPPLKRAAAPAPATARPTISMFEEVAEAHMIEPTEGMLVFEQSHRVYQSIPSKMTNALR